MNIFLCKRNLFREIAEKTIVLNYEVTNDVMMMKTFISKQNIYANAIYFEKY